MGINEVINRKLAANGLFVRGSLCCPPEDLGPGGSATLILIGFAGRGMWPIFQKTRKAEDDPLDNWTRRIVDPLAHELAALALYPFDGPPWYPFQRWAMKAESLFQSPIGPLLHPEYGLWHGYRAALAFREALPVAEPAKGRDLCAGCQASPCLAACPAGVFAGGAYDVAKCANHLKDWNNSCLSAGCLARRACPVGADYAYGSEQASFHTRAFLNAMDRFL